MNGCLNKIRNAICYPKQAEKVAEGSLTPCSVPGIFAVYPEMKWYMAWSKVSLETGGSTPNASHVSMIRFFGWPATQGIFAFGIYSIG